MTAHPNQYQPLTHGQIPIWLGQRLHPQSPLYNMAFAWLIPAELDTELFLRAWQRVVDASDALRTQVVERGGEGRRLTLGPGSCPCRFVDLAGEPDPESAFRHWCRERCARPLPLDGPLVDSVLVRLGPDRTGWYLNLHHLITDAWSTVLLYRQVAQGYAALRDPAQAPLPEPITDYYPTADALTPRTAGRDSARAHWVSRQGSFELAAPLYGRDGRPVGTESTRLTLSLDGARVQALDQLCGQAGFQGLSRDMSRFALFATLLLSWLNRVSGRSEIGFDAPVAGRPTPAAKRALGVFIELFPFAVSVTPTDSFRSLGARCLEETERFLRHALPGTSANSAAAASNIVLNYFPEPFGDFAGMATEVDWVHPGHGDHVHALRLQVQAFNGPDRIVLHFDFNRQVLTDRMRRRALEHFDRLLAALIADPDQPIGSVDLLTDEERSILQALNATGAAPLPPRTVLASIRARAEVEPGLVALRQGDLELRYGELLERLDALAASLVRLGVEPGDRVAICSRRSLDAVIAVLATLRARAAYVPVDPAYPASRVATILDDSGAHVLLTGNGAEGVKAGSAATRLAIAEGIELGRGLPLERGEPRLDDLAYLLYTSGSTGRPKGVLIEHGGLADYLQWASRRYVRGDRLSFPLFTALSFDLTVTSLFLPLITGGTLEVYPEPDGPVDSALSAVVADNRVDFIKLTPSHLALLRQLGLEGSKIRRVVVGGEDFKTQLAADISAQLNDQVEIYNEYGPTEAVVGCVMHRFQSAADTGTSVPIGVPADHVQVEILNAAGYAVPQGTPGELWVSRFGLARGYHGLRELTAERFQPHPRQLGGRRYRTGDLVRLNDNGMLEYLGRLDRQLKVSGYRIEPGEIEAALLDLPGVEQAAVLARSPGAGATAGADASRHCSRCGLPSSYPGAVFDDDGVCQLCRVYDTVNERARGYFRAMDDLRRLFAAAARPATGQYDCMMLLSGGKDSTYALCRLKEMGLSVYAFTLDNGYISDAAKGNIRRVAEALDVPVEMATTPAMREIFRDSLMRFSNVCNGCFKTIYTLSVNRALALGIPTIVTGLSRGQMFETRLTGELFRDGSHGPDEVDAAVLAARKAYHRLDDQVFRALDVAALQDDRTFEQVRFVDFYRYCDVGLDEVLDYLGRKVPWVRPQDTGRSTNCRINDVGIYVHTRERGFHNYALPYSWDVRLGHKQRDAALDELADRIDVEQVQQMLAEIGYEPREQALAGADQPRLAGYYVAATELPPDLVRRQLGERLPAPLIPARLQRVDHIPLTAHGKVDDAALDAIRQPGPGLDAGPEPEGPVQEYLAAAWQQALGVDRVSADDDFFALGGTSLVAMQVMVALCREFAIDLPLETLFSHPRLSALARVAEDWLLDEPT